MISFTSIYSKVARIWITRRFKNNFKLQKTYFTAPVISPIILSSSHHFEISKFTLKFLQAILQDNPPRNRVHACALCNKTSCASATHAPNQFYNWLRVTNIPKVKSNFTHIPSWALCLRNQNNRISGLSRRGRSNETRSLPLTHTGSRERTRMAAKTWQWKYRAVHKASRRSARAAGGHTERKPPAYAATSNAVRARAAALISLPTLPPLPPPLSLSCLCIPLTHTYTYTYIYILLPARHASGCSSL